MKSPLIQTEYDGDFKVKSHEQLNVIWRIEDPDNHEISIDFEAGSKAVSLKIFKLKNLTTNTKQKLQIYNLYGRPLV